MTQATELRRTLSLTQVTLYGLGTTIGAGIYALIGAVAGASGTHAPVAFVLASIFVAFTALSFAEMSARYPRAAGEAEYVRQGFGSPRFGLITGLLVVTAGLVSCGTVVNAFVGYANEFFAVNATLAITLLVVSLAALAAWGIAQSVWVAGALCIVEIGGLLLVVWVAGDSLGTLPERWGELVPPAELGAWTAVFAGTFLAFYAFIGFEDMVNVAEEVKDVTRTLPRAIALTLLLTLVLYALVTLVCVLTLPPATLAASNAPLALVFETALGGGSRAISAIGILALVNGALVQMIMAARVVYGLSRQGQLPAFLGAVEPRTQTPVRATALVAAIVLALALLWPLETLARATSMVILCVFAAVNLALLRVKRRDPAPAGILVFPAWVPAAGAVVSIGVLLLEGSRLLFT